MKKKLLLLIILVISLPILWYLISPLFIDKEVNEQLPITSGTSETLEQNIILKGTFKGADSSHQVQGSVNVVEINNNKYLSLTDFKSTNGPDLKVYLAKDINANEYVSLGDLKGNIGNQNYEIPLEVDLNQYSKVLIWCERFTVLFGSADLKNI
jgi:hypothetical protein